MELQITDLQAFNSTFIKHHPYCLLKIKLEYTNTIK